MPTKKAKLPEKIIKYLDNIGAKYQILEHKTVYTAYDTAVTMQRKLNEIVKTLLVSAGKDFYLVLLPADHNLDFKKLGKVVKEKFGKPAEVKIPKEKVMENLLKIKAGALSAFGGFHKINVILDKNLLKSKKALFSSGSFNHSVEMATKDFVKFENAIIGDFGIKKKIKIVKAVKKVKKSIKKKIKKKLKK